MTFSWWAEGGALTLVEFHASPGTSQEGTPLSTVALGGTLQSLLAQSIQQSTGRVDVILTRREAEWSVDYDFHPEAMRPPEARRLPIRSQGIPASSYLNIQGSVTRGLQVLEVPRGGAARLIADVHLEDGRMIGWDTHKSEVTRQGGAPRPLNQEVASEAIAVLLPFTDALGHRTVRLELEATSSRHSAHAEGRVKSATVLRPPSPAEMDEDFAAVYYAMHEDILRRWREETREGTEWVLRRGSEELILWYVGGMIGRGAGLLVEATLPTVRLVLGRGGEVAAGWFRSALVRFNPAEKQAFERLWMKVQLEGERALSSTERAALRKLMEQFERAVRLPLDTSQKGNLREYARRHYKQLHPQFAKLLDAQGFKLPIHHRRPLEYAHLFPAEDINAASNLVMLREEVHKSINGLWGRIRRAHPNATAQEIEEAARRIDDWFNHWYHRADVVSDAPVSLQEAEKGALAALKQLFPNIQ